MPLGTDLRANLHEMAHSPNHRKRVRKFGAKKAHQIEVAASANAAHYKRKGKRKHKRGGKRKSKRASRR
jgi:hypothetical protein